MKTTGSFNSRPCSVFYHLRRWRGRGGGVVRPPGDRPLIVVELRGIKQSMHFDEIFRIKSRRCYGEKYGEKVLGENLTSVGPVKGLIFAKNGIFSFTLS